MTNPLLMELPGEIRGDNVLLRPYRPGDGAAMQKAISENRAYLRPWMQGWDQHLTVEESEVFIRRCAAKWITREDLPIGMWHIATGEFLGGLGLHKIDWGTRRFEIGYWIRSEFEGRGYVTEGVRLLCLLAFDVLEANRVCIRCATSNPRSRGIPDRLGFVHEGIARFDLVRPNGELLDSHMYSLTSVDWANGVRQKFLFPVAA